MTDFPVRPSLGDAARQKLLLRRLFGPAALVLLLAYTGWQVARDYRYFSMLPGDHGWYLQVALRVSSGQILYKDVAWAYGPWPIQVVAVLFKIFGADAGVVSTTNGLLALLAVALVYLALRTLLTPGRTALFTAYAVIVGSYVSGSLPLHIMQGYTPGIAWGTFLSLASLVCLLLGQQNRYPFLVVVSGGLVGMAILSKPEYGLVALGAAVVVLVVSRAGKRSWVRWAMGCAATALGGIALQADSSGWDYLWRGYTGYDQLAQGGLWGTPGGLSSPRWLLSLVAGWFGLFALILSARLDKWRRAGRIAAGVAVLATLALISPDIMGLSGRQAVAAVTSGHWETLRVYPEVAVQWVLAAPWSGLAPILVWTAWRSRQSGLPSQWWGLWGLALLANLRYTLTGYANPLAVAPALAVLWLRWSPTWTETRRKWVTTGLSLVVLLDLVAQLLWPAFLARPPTGSVTSAIGVIRLKADAAQQIQSVQRALDDEIPVDSAVFGAGWAAVLYLTTGHPNPTRFDVVLPGLPGFGQEKASLQAQLLANPPAAVILPSWMMSPTAASRSRQRSALAIKASLQPWWSTIDQTYREVPTREAGWVVLVRQ